MRSPKWEKENEEKSTMYKLENNFAFIDSQNVNLAIRSCGWKLDYKRFRVYLREKYAVTKAFIFIGYVEWNNDLYIELQEAGSATMARAIDSRWR